MSAALVATESYGNTVIATTANTSLTAPVGGADVVLAVGSASTKRVIERSDFQAEGSTVASVVYIFKYDTTSTTSVLLYALPVPLRTITLTDNPPHVPWIYGFDCHIELASEIWQLIMTVRDTQNIRGTAQGKGYS